MKIRYFIGSVWILVSLLEFFNLSWDSVLIWLATLLIWTFIFEIKDLEEKLEARKKYGT